MAISSTAGLVGGGELSRSWWYLVKMERNTALCCFFGWLVGTQKKHDPPAHKIQREHIEERIINHTLPRVSHTVEVDLFILFFGGNSSFARTFLRPIFKEKNTELLEEEKEELLVRSFFGGCLSMTSPSLVG